VPGSDQHVTSKRLVSNSKWNLAAFACGLAAQFLTVPFVIQWIGLSGFGQAGLVLAVWAPLMLVGAVLGQATTREMSARLAAGNPQAASRVIDAAMLMCLGACVFGGVALAAVGPGLLSALVSDDCPTHCRLLSSSRALGGRRSRPYWFCRVPVPHGKIIAPWRRWRR